MRTSHSRSRLAELFWWVRLSLKPWSEALLQFLVEPTSRGRPANAKRPSVRTHTPNDPRSVHGASFSSARLSPNGLLEICGSLAPLSPLKRDARRILVLIRCPCSLGRTGRSSRDALLPEPGLDGGGAEGGRAVLPVAAPPSLLLSRPPFGLWSLWLFGASGASHWSLSSPCPPFFPTPHLEPQSPLSACWSWS